VRVGDAVVLIDVDRFREINTQRGHSGGDAVLAAFGRVVRVGLRGGDHGVRPGGDEFVLVLRQVQDTRVLSVLGRVRDRWQHECGQVTFSAGVAVCGPGQTGPQLLRRADTHCYTAKAAGRDQWVLDDTDAPDQSSSPHSQLRRRPDGPPPGLTYRFARAGAHPTGAAAADSSSWVGTPRRMMTVKISAPRAKMPAPHQKTVV